MKSNTEKIQLKKIGYYKDKICRIMLQREEYLDDLQAMYDRDLEELDTVDLTEMFKDEKVRERWAVLADRLEELEDERDSVLSFLATTSYYDKHMTPWSIILEGVCTGNFWEDEEGLSQDDFDELSEQFQANADQMMEEVAGANFVGIKNSLLAKGYDAQEVVVSQSSWKLCYACTDRDASKLCKMVHKVFVDELDYGIIKLSREFTGFNIIGFGNRKKIEDYAKQNNITKNTEGKWY